jgi:hypothetical protein
MRAKALLSEFANSIGTFLLVNYRFPEVEALSVYLRMNLDSVGEVNCVGDNGYHSSNSRNSIS